ncbi:MAG: pilus assembly protein TadG-related protein [Dehalococcoidia bacterium]
MNTNHQIARYRDERGQVLPVVALLLVLFIGMMGLAVDVGRLYVARAELVRAVDAAALAGVLESTAPAAQTKATAYLEENQPSAEVTFPASTSESFKVKGTRSVGMIFMKVLGFGAVDISANATAGFGNVRSDTVLILDATSSMGDSPCNGSQSNSGCPIKEAKGAANSFIDTLLAGSTGYSKVGFAPYRGCYNPPRTNNSCVPTSMIQDLTTSASALHTKVDATSASGGTGTNVCLGLYEGQSMFNGANATPGATVVKSLVILTDGDNHYNSSSFGQGAPPSECRPGSPNSSDSSSGCSPSQSSERTLDTKTVALATALEAQGVQIYVVAFGACGTSNSSKPSDPGYCNGVGNNDHDNAADRRLLKCIASSTDTTNDHYFEVPTATDLPAVFQTIAKQIGFRLTE